MIAQRSSQTPERRARPTTRGRAAADPNALFVVHPRAASLCKTSAQLLHSTAWWAANCAVHVQVHLAAPGERLQQLQRLRQLIHAHAPCLLQGVPGVRTPAAQGSPDGDPTALVPLLLSD